MSSLPAGKPSSSSGRTTQGEVEKIGWGPWVVNLLAALWPGFWMPALFYSRLWLSGLSVLLIVFQVILFSLSVTDRSDRQLTSMGAMDIIVALFFGLEAVCWTWTWSARHLRCSALLYTYGRHEMRFRRRRAQLNSLGGGAEDIGQSMLLQMSPLDRVPTWSSSSSSESMSSSERFSGSVLFFLCRLVVRRGLDVCVGWTHVPRPWSCIVWMVRGTRESKLFPDCVQDFWLWPSAESL